MSSQSFLHRFGMLVVIVGLMVFSTGLNSKIVRADDEMKPGYTLISPLFSTETQLFNNAGKLVHSWTLKRTSGGVGHLLKNGHLLQAEAIDKSEWFPEATRTGGHGFLSIYDWDGKLVWEYSLHTETQLSHHNIEVMPNGNIMLIVYERVQMAEALAAGRNPSGFAKNHDDFWSEGLIELDPNTNKIVWEWHLMDHLVQDFDATRANHADPAEHPELVNLNYISLFPETLSLNTFLVEWIHANAVSYNPKLDQILFNARNFGEIWIIDHSTTTQEAASHRGGKYGKGGDLLFRWGNPLAYRAGGKADEMIWFQHDARWIADGLPGAGNITIFDNGSWIGRTSSRVIEIALDRKADGGYDLLPRKATTAKIVWEYTLNPSDFSLYMGAAQRQPNGNTIIADGWKKYAVEVTAGKKLIWEYHEPKDRFIFRADRYPLDHPAFAGKNLPVN